ncbi:unnamed protein product [Protopolystoma xenopodis]|uniref:ATPase dynein-related AAA domain-containing protein n=1 Tax=Protopolystoma xenopodis TaxID=117903 RepID=A0A448X8C8_9PLAT|nr:unnamed protein product [Protopolystoma xenopodis]
MRHPTQTALTNIASRQKSDANATAPNSSAVNTISSSDTLGVHVAPRLADWLAFNAQLTQLQAQLRANATDGSSPHLGPQVPVPGEVAVSGCPLFTYVEGCLVRALRQGDWVLLDEINLAPTDLLDGLSGMLESRHGSIILTDRG